MNIRSVRRSPTKKKQLAELATAAALQSDFSIEQLGDIVGLPEGWSLDEWVEFEERAAILEYDGGYAREEAERLAAEELKPPGADHKFMSSQLRDTLRQRRFCSSFRYGRNNLSRIQN